MDCQVVNPLPLPPPPPYSPHHNLSPEAELELQVQYSNCPDEVRCGVVGGRGGSYTYTVKTIQLTTCGPLYSSWSNRKSMYARAAQGITVDVEYADSIDSCSQPDVAPVILALHGAPGNHEDYRPFIEHYSARNVRIIVPNFPDFRTTIRTRVFRHSAAEKFHYIQDFLAAIGITKIDLLMAHSSAVYPATMMMCEAPQLSIRSLVLFNPAGHRRIQAMRPAWFTEGSVKIYQNKFGRAVFKVFGKSFIKVTNSVTVKPESMNNVMLSAQTMRYSNYPQLEENIKIIKKSKIPLLYAFSENDRLVEADIFYEMMQLMGADESNLQRYDINAKPCTEYNQDDNIRVLAFQTGGHYAFLKYAAEVICECDKFLNFVLSSS